MIELLGANKDSNIYSSTVLHNIESKEIKLNFGIEKPDFSRLKRILEFQPFQNGGFRKYRYFFTTKYSSHPEQKELYLINNNYNVNKGFEFELSKKYISNLLWLNRINRRCYSFKKQLKVMSINIYKEENFETIKHLSQKYWDLPTQMNELEKWLNTEGKKLPKGKYIADIGFEIRKNASGGGAVLNSKMINILSEIGMEIYFSEYNSEK